MSQTVCLKRPKIWITFPKKMTKTTMIITLDKVYCDIDVDNTDDNFMYNKNRNTKFKTVLIYLIIYTAILN